MFIKDLFGGKNIVFDQKSIDVKALSSFNFAPICADQGDMIFFCQVGAHKFGGFVSNI